MRPIDADALEKDYRSQFEAVYKNTRDVVMPSDFYIERQAAYNKALVKMEMETFFEYLQARPTIDAVQVIRCADCAYYGKSPFGHPHIGWCRIDCKHRKPEFYCANADRK